ncbi:MAG: DUF4175 domain-containing protein [Saprospiraceae bacterium]|nr:DUF4175 domain-containing protein [Saprospiraceae bacterium]
MAATSNFDLLIEKLDQFVRKYYINQLLKGSLYFVGLTGILFLAMNLLEHYYYFGTGTRKLLFYSFILTSVASGTYWVAMPLIRYFRLGKTISREKAAELIGQHFSDVSDKLLNTLQLNQYLQQAEDNSLLLASIEQKSAAIKLVPFVKAIDLSKNRKYLRYALPPLLVLLFILIAAPGVITDSTNRLINNSKEFVKPAPFTFVVDASALEVVQYCDFDLAVKITGRELPNEAFIEFGDYQYRLSQVAPDEFSYRFSNVKENTVFRLSASGVSSEKLELKVLEKPNILGFEVNLDYPSYVGRTDETRTNTGDLIVPEGTQINWVFNAEHTGTIQVKFSATDTYEEATRFSKDSYSLKRKASKDEQYQIFVRNEELPTGDSISYSITVIPDQYPDISVNVFADSTLATLLYFAGEASDDYGLLSLSFNYQLQRASGETSLPVSIKLDNPSAKAVQYEYAFDLTDLDLRPGDEVSYYFEVFDNDQINGSKSSRTNPMRYAKPSVEAYKAQAEENEDLIKSELEDALKEAAKIQEDLKKMREKLLQQKNLNWQDKKSLEDLLERQKEVQQKVEEAKEAFEENLENQQEFNEMDEALLEKQEQLQELFEELMSEEMQQLMEQIEELMQQLEKDQALEMMDEMQMNDSEMEKELDRMLELFKQLELEQEMKEMLSDLDELSKQQEDLQKETEQSAKDPENAQSQDELQQKQEEINEQFEKLQQEMKDIQEKNNGLENPKKMEDYEQQMEDIKQDLDLSEQELQKEQNDKAAKSQKNAAKGMKEMAASMQSNMQAGEMEQLQLDMASLRQLLENLVGLSFDQEDLITALDETNINTPAYTSLVQDQFKLKDDFKLVEDSLQALSKRVFQIESFVTGKVTDINRGLQQSIDELEERKKVQAGRLQQLTMTNINDLALMLSEVLNQMQQQMSSMRSSGKPSEDEPQDGNKPQDQNTPSDQMSKGQQQLNDQLKRMKEALENGEQAKSEEYARMAARQAALRKAMREKQQKLREQGKGDKELQEMIDLMDETETDLVNKRLNNQTLERQQDIQTRLLEYEKAERQREYDEKRKSEVAKNVERKRPPSMEEYLKKRSSEIDLYKTVSPSLKPYYKFLVESYFQNLKDKPGN